MRTIFLALFAIAVVIGQLSGAVLESRGERFRRDVVETVKSVYNTVALGTKAVFNDMIGNNHVAVESYRQASDESQKVGPAFSGIFVNPNKVTLPPGPPPKSNVDWNT